MGNSPSKNEPLPKSSKNSSSNNSSSSNGTISDLDSDEKSPALSQPKTYSNIRLISKDDISKKKNEINDEKTDINKSTSQAIDIKNTKNKDDSRLSLTNSTTSSNSFGYPKMPSKAKGSSSKFKNSNGDNQYLLPSSYDLDIGLSMAQILKEQQNSPSSLGSSDFSVSTSPIFTTIGNDSSKETDSLSSTSSSFRNGKHSEFFDGNENQQQSQQSQQNLSLVSKLDSIAEAHSIESSPEPSKLSHANLKKHNNVKKKYSSPLGVTKEITKFKSESSSTVTSVSPPLVPTSKILNFDIDAIIERLLSTKKRSTSKKLKDHLPVEINEIKFILGKSRQIFMDQPSLLRLSPPVKVVGDIHGQFHDLLRIFNCCGYPPQSNYLFLGDYVDRGEKSLETILLLLCYKIKYPENFFMLRGNHESANITKIYGFYDECKRRLKNTKIWKNFVDVFNSLPIAAVINDKIFCVHGGLSPDLTDFKQIENIKRPTDVPDKGLLADLLWSDPDSSVKNFSLNNWPKNDRGVSYCFGKKHVDYFCSKFKLDLIVRGHMVVEDGYEFFDKRKLVTVFSAPNYCGEFNNYGAIMSVDKKLFCSFELIRPN
ncbi:uncharacterized protein KGF55_003006 [Candida pseudojiufengensis]|uniref:uncharacterized protein n=1 Tax=Candida pseudojiufengensis TaxID=497109 RepID=UPI0022259050|nr:uncharacterized protein KGF55_003006 [Candida pseudojiufengensis]KAI5963214.1 hypothetical protein KGF55_003006 [Candida pseudojiufengensis]